MKWFLLCTVFAMGSGLLVAECRDESIHIWGGAIIWKPMTDGVEYLATKTDGSPNFSVDSAAYLGHALCPQWDWGFRVGADYRRPGGCLTAELSGEYIDFRASDQTAGFMLSALPLLGSNIRTTGSGRGSLHLCYWDVVFRIRGALFRDCASGLSLFGGIKYVQLDERLDVRQDGENATSNVQQTRQRRRQEFSGVGPEAGIAGSLCLWDGVHALGELGVVTLIGTPKNETRSRIINFNAPDRTANQVFRNDHCVALVPGMTSRVVLRYGFCGCFVSGYVQVGYDLLYYWDVLHRSLRTESLNPAPNVRTLPVDMGFAGPSVAVGLSF